MRARLLLPMLFVAGAACSGSTEPSRFTNLPGVWEWVGSVDVQTQQRHTPASEGFIARLEFIPETHLTGTFRYSFGTDSSLFRTATQSGSKTRRAMISFV